MSAKIVFLLYIVLVEQCCSEQFKYRRPLMEKLLQEYQNMNWQVLDLGKSVLQAYEDEINCCMHTSSTETQQFLGRIVLTKRNIEAAPRPTSLFKLSLLQDSVLSLTKPNSKLPELLYKDFSVFKEKITKYQTEYLEKMNKSISKYITQLSAPRLRREAKFVSWFNNLKNITDVDSMFQRVHQYFLVSFQVDPQRFDSSHQLNLYVLEQYTRFFGNLDIRYYEIEYFKSVMQNAIERYQLDETFAQFTAFELDRTSTSYYNEDKYLRLYELRTNFYTHLRFGNFINKTLSDYPDDYDLKQSTYLRNFEAEALEKYWTLMNAVTSAFDNFFEHQTTDEYLSSLRFIWFERFESLSGWEQLHAIEEYLAGIEF